MSTATRRDDTHTGAPDAQEAAFIARVTASATHEIRNVLAIVRESAGLIDDLVRSADQRGLDHTRLLKSAERIASQVARGAEIVTSLNRFAHGLEGSHEVLDLGEEVQQAAFLCQRFARQRNHAIVVRPGERDLGVRVPALRLYMVLFAAMEYCMDGLPGPGTVTVRAVRHRRHSAVEVGGEVAGTPVASTPAAAARRSELVRLARELGGSVEGGEGETRFQLVLPASGVA